MRSFGFALIAIALLLFIAPRMPAARADSGSDNSSNNGKSDKDKKSDKKGDKKGDKKADQKKDGKSGAFEVPEDKPKYPEKPVPADYTFTDYRLTMHTDDGRFWKKLPINDKEKEQGIVLSQRLKLPKSSDFFDCQIQVQGFDQKGRLKFADGSTLGASNYKGLAEKFFKDQVKSWKDVRDKRKPRPRRLSREISRAYVFSLTGTPPKVALPLHLEVWVFKFKDKTYALNLLFSTKASKDKRITKMVDEMLRTLRKWREKRRR